MISINSLRSGVLCGVLLMLASTCHAGSAMGPITFQVEAGKVSFDTGLNTSALTSKGYTVNSYSQSTVDEDSHGLSISIPVTSKISAELGLQKMGEINRR